MKRRRIQVGEDVDGLDFVFVLQPPHAGSRRPLILTAAPLPR